MSKLRAKRRIFAMFSIFIFIFVALIGRTAYWQFVRGEEMQNAAIDQQTRDRLITSRRGSITDRNGKPLAVSASVESASISPAELRASIEKSDKLTEKVVASEVGAIIGVEEDEVLEKIMNNTSYVILKRKMEKEEADRLRTYISEKGISGINLDEDSKRYYPYGDMASQLIGFTGNDNQGLEGIEAVCDSVLKGVEGRVVSSKNAHGVEMPFDYETYIDPENGMNVMLTIDESIQHFAEKYLDEAVEENSVENGAVAIVMDVKTGEILALANKPSYDLNDPFTLVDPDSETLLEEYEGEEKTKKYSELLQKQWRNKAISDTYEPGSTFKIMVAAMAVEEGVIDMDSDTFYCGGSKNVADRTINCWKHGGHGMQNFAEAIQHSCNPAFMEIGAKVGSAKFREYFTGFGFFEKTGIELSGEVTSIFFDDSNFNEVELATSSFGQGFSVTPIQMISAVSAIANNGDLMWPHLIKAYTDDSGNIIKSFEPKKIRQIISKETSKTVRSLLEKVVSQGTASNAYVAGYRVAGKTGTSEKFPRNNGKYIASFIGFAPADDPQVACLVLLDEPMGSQYFGGIIAAPVVGKIMADTLTYLNVEPQYTQEEMANMETPVPDVRQMTVAQAQETLSGKNLKSVVEGAGETVVSMIPQSGIKVNLGSTITLYTEQEKEANIVTVPDLTGCSVSQATQMLSDNSLNIKLSGAATSASTGMSYQAFSQSPAAGSQVPQGTIVTVEFRTLEVGE